MPHFFITGVRPTILSTLSLPAALPISTARRWPDGDPAGEHRMLHLLSLAAGRAAAVRPPLSAGGRADRGRGDPPPRPGAARRPHRPRDRVQRRSPRPAGVHPPPSPRAGRA